LVTVSTKEPLGVKKGLHVEVTQIRDLVLGQLPESSEEAGLD
jgi:hypothetical protein